jgi:hypothetical protein
VSAAGEAAGSRALAKQPRWPVVRVGATPARSRPRAFLIAYFRCRMHAVAAPCCRMVRTSATSYCQTFLDQFDLLWADFESRTHNWSQRGQAQEKGPTPARSRPRAFLLAYFRARSANDTVRCKAAGRVPLLNEECVDSRVAALRIAYNPFQGPRQPEHRSPNGAIPRLERALGCVGCEVPAFGERNFQSEPVVGSSFFRSAACLL